MLPTDEIDRLQDRRRALEEEKADLTRQIEEAAANRRRIENTIDYYTVRAEKYRIIGELGHTRHTFLVTGYIPEVDLPLLKDRLETRFSLLLEAEPAEDGKAPVKLRNNAFVRPAETITEMYALPLTSDIDPTPVMSIFYYLFFGMMLSDAGYGLLLVLGSWFLIKKCRPEPGMRRNLQLFFCCGVATVFWGLAFGSFFGDAIPLISGTFFGHEVNLPRLLDPMTQAVELLVLSLVLGFLQIMVGMGCKFYVQWRSGDRWGAVFDTGFWDDRASRHRPVAGRRDADAGAGDGGNVDRDPVGAGAGADGWPGEKGTDAVRLRARQPVRLHQLCQRPDVVFPPDGPGIDHRRHGLGFQ